MTKEVPDLIEMDGEKCRAIVASLRMYLHFCKEANNVPKAGAVEDIAWMRDNGTKAMYEAAQIGADDA